MIKRLFISILLQLLLIPISYWIIYAIARVFHEPYVRSGGDGMDFYALTLIYLTWFVIITLPILNLIQVVIIKNKIISTLLHISWFVFIIWFTKGDLKYRPYDYGLILFCVGLTIGTRLLINEIIKLPTTPTKMH
tara:strand:+ start:50 stop:454 length:405 start_codon:yes stop_codon:yes gene_type:complete